MIELAWSSSPKIFYWYVFIIVQNDWPCLEFFAQIFLQVYISYNTHNDWYREEFLAQNFLLVQIHYYTEWLSLRGVLRPKFFIGMFL